MLGLMLHRGQPEAQNVCWSYELSSSYLAAHPQQLHSGVLAVNLLIRILGLHKACQIK